MSEYHKIQSLYKRDMQNNGKSFLLGQYTRPEFEYLKDAQWDFSEKVDGTNVRVYWNRNTGVRIEGRTKDAQMPTSLFASLTGKLPATNFEKAFTDMAEEVILYGEGYGAKIQKGGGDYRQDQGFILFDVYIGMWLKRGDVKIIADNLGVPFAPSLGTGTLAEAEECCRVGFASHLRKTPPEGLVLRPVVELLNRRGNRIITKLKLKDFQHD